MAQVISIENLEETSVKNIFVDTNVWIYLFCEIAETKKGIVKKYSGVFRDLLKSDYNLFTEISVISEFVNRYLRLAYEKYKSKYGIKSRYDYKRDYRKTRDFQTSWKTVCSIVEKKILSVAKIVNLKYDKDSLLTLLNPEIFDRDFTDNHILRICSENNFLLLTNDSDFKNGNIGIISGNQVYFKQNLT